MDIFRAASAGENPSCSYDARSASWSRLILNLCMVRPAEVRDLVAPTRLRWVWSRSQELAFFCFDARRSGRKGIRPPESPGNEIIAETAFASKLDPAGVCARPAELTVPSRSPGKRSYPIFQSSRISADHFVSSRTKLCEGSNAALPFSCTYRIFAIISTRGLGIYGAGLGACFAIAGQGASF